MLYSEKLVAKDVAKVKREAQVLFEILPDGTVSQKENLRGKLSVIAVVGPGEAPLGHNNKTSRALLCEVGFWKSKPYKRTRSGITLRRKWFALSERQYRLIGGLVWTKLQEIAKKKVDGWKNKTFDLPIWKQRFWKRDDGVTIKSTRQSFPKGVRFSFDLRDTYLVDDSCWAELCLNRQLRQHTGGLAGYIALCLRKYPQDGRSFAQFSRLKGGQSALGALVGLQTPKYVLVEALLRLPGGTHFPHIEHLAEAIEWDHLPTEERRAVQRAETIGIPSQRLGDVQLRINRKTSWHVVVEIYPPLTSLQQTPLVLSADNEEEDIF